MPTRDFIPSIPIETEVYTSSAGPLFPELNASKEGLAPPRVFSSMDIVAYAVLPSKKVYKLGSLSMLSISSHRDKFPVTSLGSIAVRGFCSGHRTIGGTLVFNTYDRNVWYRLVEGRSEYPLRQINYIMPDELPAFDITITLVNENGDVAFTGLHGVTILDEGETMSVDNIAIMESYSYMAVSKIPLQPYNAGLLFEQLNSGLPSVPLTQLPSSLSSTQVPA